MQAYDRKSSKVVYLYRNFDIRFRVLDFSSFGELL